MDTYDSLKGELQQVDCVMEKDSENLIKRFIGVGGQPQEVIQSLSDGYRGFPQMINLLQEWSLLMGMTEEQVHTEIIRQTKKIVKTKFNSQKADSIFTQAQAPPVWLEEMVNEKEWRQLIYELSEDHPKCLMLSFAIQRIAEAGHHEEIGSLRSASRHYQVFNGIVENSLQKIMEVESFVIPELLPQFLKLSCNSSHTFLYTQRLLAFLASQTESNVRSDRAKRLSHELYQHLRTVVAPGQKFWLKVKHLICMPPASLVTALEFIIYSSATNPGDMMKIHTLYSSDNPPSVRFIQDSAFINLLVTDLFTVNSIVQQSYIRKYSFVLAYATSISSSEEEDSETREKKMKPFLEAIGLISKLCKQNKPVSGDGFKELGFQLDQHLHLKVVSAGIVKYLSQSYFADSNYYASPTASVATPMFYYLLRRMILQHPFHREAIFKLYCKIFQIEPNVDALGALEVKKQVIQELLFLMLNGFIFPVFTKIFEWHPTMDNSLIRLFVIELLEKTQGPYSQAFTRRFVELLAQPVCTEALLRKPEPVLLFLNSMEEKDEITLQVLSKFSNAIARE